MTTPSPASFASTASISAAEPPASSPARRSSPGRAPRAGCARFRRALSSRPCAPRELVGCRDRRLSRGLRVHASNCGKPLGRDPQAPIRRPAIARGRARAVASCLEERRPAFVRLHFAIRHEAKPEQRIVQLVRAFAPGHASARTRSMALPSSRPRSAAVASSSQRRAITACVRRSSSGASSRYAYGRAVRISSASGDGCVSSRATTSIVAGFDAAQHALEPVDIHRLVQAVVHGLLHERMIRNLARAGEVLRARDLVRKHRRHQVFGAHALQRRRHLLAAAKTRQRERRARDPAPARREHRRREHRLDQHVTNAARVQVAGDVRRAESCGWSTATGRSHPRSPRPAARNRTCTQKRLRSASPHARLMRLPYGEWMTSCMPPDSSKKRSSTIVVCVGSTPSAACADARYSTSWLAGAGRHADVAIERRDHRFACQPLLERATRPARANATRRATARRSVPAPRRARTGSSAAGRAHPRLGRGRPRRAGCGTTCCRAGRCRRRGSRRRSPRARVPTSWPAGSSTTS